MKRRRASLSLATLLWCPLLAAQQQEPQCSTTPPEHKLDREGNILRESREWDPDQCILVNPERMTGEVISTRTLSHKPLKAARKEFDRGVQAWRKGQSDEAMRQFTEAVRLDPGFVEAQVELGALYAEGGQPAVALDYFNRALSLEPNWASAHTAKAGALVVLDRPEEAEPAARRALLLDPRSTAAHYMLGLALAMQQKNTPEAAAQLKLAADRYPRARAFLTELQAAFAGQNTGK